jgi:hypothetical protein
MTAQAGKRADANGVRVERAFDALVDWSTVPGLAKCADPDAAKASALEHMTRISGRADQSGDAFEAAQREAEFDAALEHVNLSDHIAQARAKRRDAMRIGRAAARKPEDQVKADRAAERKAIRKGAREAEARSSSLPTVSRVDVFGNLAARGSLPDICVRAGHDIDRIITAVEAGVFAASDPDTLLAGGVKVSGRRGAPQFMAVEGYVDRYFPWTKRLTAPEYRRAGLPGRAVIAVVVAVVKDGRTLSDIDRAVGKRKGTAMGLLCDGLREYARVAGWTSSKKGD